MISVDTERSVEFNTLKKKKTSLVVYIKHVQLFVCPSYLDKMVFKKDPVTSLVAQWLRIHLSMQGTRVPALVQEDPTCCGATKPMRHNY